jgi:hypothetical protein
MVNIIATINETDINLICELDLNIYKKTMNGIVSEDKQKEFKEFKNRMQALSNLYKNKYDKIAGVFESERATGNPISYHGKLRRVWSGIYKGSENKQYSAQISFVINTKDRSLDVGFYFGRASSLNINKETRSKWVAEIKELGKLLYNQINSNPELQKAYYSLFDFGFKAEIRGNRVTSEEWLLNLNTDPTYSSIVFSLRPNEKGAIESASIDLYVAMVMPLIGVLPERIADNGNRVNLPKKVKPLSPEQRAKQAEKRTLIGLAGEEYVMQLEKEKLKEFAFSSNRYPIHQSLISDSFGYDILSSDSRQNELFIEVKTTTLLREEKAACIFFISSREYDFYVANINKYRLYRVYDIYGKPTLEILDLSQMRKSVDNYRMEIIF